MITCDFPNINCKECSKIYEMPYPCCCLPECGEHQFCYKCDKGIYLKNKKETD